MSSCRWRVLNKMQQIKMKILLLNSTYEPLDIVSMERAMILLVNNKVEVIHQHRTKKIRSVNTEYPYPEVVRLKHFVRLKRKDISPTKKNIILRDGCCQYCGSTHKLTIDHVIPKSKGGKDTWTNLVACCHSCNNKKGDKSVEEIGFVLLNKPTKPHSLKYTRDYSKFFEVNSWEDYLFVK
jgi:5-methylcytosine-specific restriction endonuclease McrA